MAVYYAREIRASTADKQRPSVVRMASDLGYCWVQGSNDYWYRTFLKYDLSKIPYGSAIASAKLRVYDFWHNDNGANGTTNIARITSNWEEDSICWNVMPATAGTYLTNNVSSPGIGKWSDWDITSLVQEWVNRVHPNHGLMIVNNNEGDYRADWKFYNRYHSNSGEYATYIEIEYEPEEEFRISKARMTEICDEVRRITRTTNQLDPAGIVDALAKVTV